MVTTSWNSNHKKAFSENSKTIVFVYVVFDFALDITINGSLPTGIDLSIRLKIDYTSKRENIKRFFLNTQILDIL